jgi:CDP-diacylglycerol--glycerol-3-phosphate 3-phosphatidyltransferase
MVVFYYLPQPISTVGAALVFIVASITDWLDGWLARKMNQTSEFGAFLDPVADKLLVSVALILLLHRMDNAFITLAAMVVIGREIVVSALREWMAQAGNRASVAVTSLAKLKTGFQMTAIPILLWYPSEPAGEYLRLLGLVLLGIAVVLTLWSMAIYFKVFWPALKAKVLSLKASRSKRVPIDGLTRLTHAAVLPAMVIAVSYFTSSIDSSAVTLKIFTSAMRP